MADRYNNINNTSPYVSALKNDERKIPRSNFDYGRSHHGNMNIGNLEILDCFPTLPNSDYTLAMDLLLKVRVALNKRIMTGQRCFVHAWYMSYNDLWEAAQNHIDHGRSGLLDIQKPYSDGYGYDQNSNINRDFFTPNSVFNQLGVPARRQNDLDKLYSYVYASSLQSDFATSLIQDFSINVNALPAVMYQRVYLDKYAPKNLIQDNKNAYPDNAERSRIPYNATRVDCLQNTSGSVTIPFSNQKGDPNSPLFILNSNVSPVLIGNKRFRQKKGDYFITSSPFADLLRGDAPTIDLTNVISNIDFSDVVMNASQSASNNDTVKFNYNTEGTVPIPIGLSTGNNIQYQNALLSLLNRAKVNTSIQTQVTANMLRTVIALSLIKERNALTNGDYNEMIQAQFGYSPSVDDFSAKYIGGFYQDITFSDVTQTAPTSDYPLGYQSGQAMSANSGFIGKFHSNDFGYIMIIASIVPDEVYNQGIPRFLGELSADEEYASPILNNLPPQAIKNKEIYLTNDSSVNEDVFSYTQRYEHLRHRENYASGFVGLDTSVSLEDKDYIQHKVLQSSPQFNAKFVSLCPDNVDMSIYAVQTEPPYIFTAISKVDKIEPLPYDSMPSDFGFAFA